MSKAPKVVHTHGFNCAGGYNGTETAYGRSRRRAGNDDGRKRMSYTLARCAKVFRTTRQNPESANMGLLCIASCQTLQLRSAPRAPLLATHAATWRSTLLLVAFGVGACRNAMARV